jgi:hypothetical protein
MAMKKSEMEAHRDAYEAIQPQVWHAMAHGAFVEAIKLAKSSWPYIDGMMQWARKYEERQLASVETIDVVLRCAPLALDLHSLTELETLLREERRIDRDATDDLGRKLIEARVLLWEAHRLWSYLETHPGVRQDELRQALGGSQERWRSLAEGWEKMGLLRRAPESGSYRLTPATRMNEVVAAKCPHCGRIAEETKAAFLDELGCLECRTSSLHVILATKGESA